MVKSEKQLEADLRKPFFKGMNAFQLRFLVNSKDRKLSKAARAELKRRNLKLR